MPKTLTSRQRYLLEHPELLKDLNPQRRGAFYRDIRKKAFQELEDLTFLAQCLPERQQNKVFNKDRVLPLIRAIFHIELEMGEKDLQERRKRLLKLLEQVLYHIGDRTFALKLAPEVMKALIHSADTLGLKAIFVASMYED